MEALIDASQGRRRSLADVEEYQLLARGMSDLGAYAVFLSDKTWSVKEYAEENTWELLSTSYTTQEDVERIIQELEQSPLLRPYLVYATGVGKDTAGQYIALVLVHGDKASAEENQVLLRRRIQETSSLLSWQNWQPWRERVDRIEIRTEGRVLLAKLHGDVVRERFGYVSDWDALLLYE